MPMHAALLRNSARLQAIFDFLLERGAEGATTREISERTGAMSVSTYISELRANGKTVTATYEGTNENGARIYRYRMTAAPVQTELFRSA